MTFCKSAGKTPEAGSHGWSSFSESLNGHKLRYFAALSEASNILNIVKSSKSTVNSIENIDMSWHVHLIKSPGFPIYHSYITPEIPTGFLRILLHHPSKQPWHAAAPPARALRSDERCAPRSQGNPPGPRLCRALSWIRPGGFCGSVRWWCDHSTIGSNGEICKCIFTYTLFACM